MLPLEVNKVVQRSSCSRVVVWAHTHTHTHRTNCSNLTTKVVGEESFQMLFGTTLFYPRKRGNMFLPALVCVSVCVCVFVCDHDN